MAVMEFGSALQPGYLQIEWQSGSVTPPPPPGYMQIEWLAGMAGGISSATADCRSSGWARRGI